VIDELEQFDRRRERGMLCRRDAVFALANAAGGSDSAVTFAPGSTPPWPGFAPCESLISIIFTCGSVALALKRSSLKRPSRSRQPK
jgi:hypothetical protein